SVEAAWFFAAQWATRVLKAPLDDECRGLLAEAFCGVLGGLLGRQVDRSREALAKNDLQLTPRMAHERLDRFFGRPTNLENVVKYVTEWAEHDIARLMLVDVRTLPAEALKLALDTPTAKQLLADVVQAHATGTWVNVPSGIFSL